MKFLGKDFHFLKLAIISILCPLPLELVSFVVFISYNFLYEIIVVDSLVVLLIIGMLDFVFDSSCDHNNIYPKVITFTNISYLITVHCKFDLSRLICLNPILNCQCLLSNSLIMMYFDLQDQLLLVVGW